MRVEPGVIARPRSGRGDLGGIASAASPARKDSSVRQWVSALKRICGMPDYPGYLHHMADRHPGRPVLTERQFYDEQVQSRYGNGASRCC